MYSGYGGEVTLNTSLCGVGTMWERGRVGLHMYK